MRRFFCSVWTALCLAALVPAAQETPSRLDIAAQPEGAQVFVDGTLRGSAPCSVFGLPSGRHLVHVQAPNHVDFDEFVRIDRGQFVQKSCVLAEEKGLVLVKTAPAGADVRCNGVSLGTTPLLLTTLASGRVHALELVLTGYVSKKIDVRTEGRTPIVCEERLSLDSGVVICTTEPPGATVVVNGVERGVTPMELGQVPKGVASVTLRLAGYREETRELRLSPGDRQTLAVKLVGLPARLKVVSSPEQAKVFLDNDYQGKTPLDLASVAPGKHTLRIELAGHAPLVRTVTLANGAESTEEFRMDSVLGRLEVTSAPPGAKISVDGHAVGFTKSQGGDAASSQVLSIEKVAAGEHSVVAHLDGYQDVSRTVVVKAHDTGKIAFKLRRIFTPNTEIETIRGIYRGVFVEKDYVGNVTLETSPGVQQTFRQEDIRKIAPIGK